jgi:predicted ATPase/transcriptional regulator with XRE-family HTH domain
MPAMDPTNCADLLRQFRRRRRLTQEELAARAGISPGAVSQLERGLTRTPQKATVRLLSAALALAPDEEATFLAATREGRWSAGDSPTGAPAAAPFGGNLPVPLTSLVGRERDQVALLELLEQPTTRLLTLTGPAGVGKTRLALELSASLRREPRHEVVFVGLIPVQESERVLPAIAQALGVRQSGGLPLRDALVHALRDRRLVLVLDNFEQVLPASRGVLELLIACPAVKALVTSRSSLNVRGERCYPVLPLALPDPALMDSLDELRRAPTVALFLERAAAAQPDFAIATPEEGRLVAEICARLDGLPLAIELAAARVKPFGLRQLQERLSQPALLGLLAEGPQDLADHQRTMRSTISWSYDLLGGEEARLFRWLGVFVGGASVDGIKTVSGLPDDVLLVGLAALVDASLLQSADVAGARRHTQLVTLRAYAQERLQSEGEWEDARRRHAEYCLGLTELIVQGVADQPEGVFEQVETEYENIRAALAWAWETGATAHGLRMVSTLRRFWYMRSQFLEGLDWLERFVARAGAPVSREEQFVLAQALTGVLVMAHRLDRFERAQDAGEMALTLARAYEDSLFIGGALSNLATNVAALRDYDRALALFDECLVLLRKTANRRGMVFPLLNLGGLYHEMGRPWEALACYEESLALSREIGESDYARALSWNCVGEVYLVLDKPSRAVEVTEPNYQLYARERGTYGTAMCAFTLGRAQWRLGDAETACAHLEETERHFRTLGIPVMAARVRYFRASLALDQGDIAAARGDLAQALTDLMDYVCGGEYIWWLVERGGTLALLRGEPEQAARLYGAAMANRDASPRPMDPAEREMRERDLERLRAALGESTLASRLAEGQTLSLDDAVTLLRQEFQQPGG